MNDQISSMSGLLERVQAAPTIAGGLAIITGVLGQGLGPTITEPGYSPDAGGTPGQSAPPADINCAELSGLYNSLLIDNAEWAGALVANTQGAAPGQETATRSSSAFA